VAPVQAVVIAVKDDERTTTTASALVEALAAAGVRARLDARTTQGFGRRATEWELKGVPLRIEVGPRDLESGQVTIARRDTGEKAGVPLDGVAAAVPDLLESVHTAMLESARTRLADRTAEASTAAEALEAARTGFARVPWRLLGTDGERELNQQAVSVRCLQTPDGAVPSTDDTADHPADELVAIVGRSY
jgi:prolyl-tRNA synthetase